MITRSLLFAALLSLCWSPLLADHPQAWIGAYLPFAELNDVKFFFWQQYRFALSSVKLVDNRYTIGAKKSLRRWLDGEIHYTLVYARGSDETAFKQARRLELELNPHFDLTKKTELKLRNRYECINREDDPKQRQNLRHRDQIVRKIEGSTIKTISIHHEIFYNIEESRVFEYRFVPLEIGFALGEKRSYKVYHMIRWLKPATLWETQYVCGLSFDL